MTSSISKSITGSTEVLQGSTRQLSAYSGLDRMTMLVSSLGLLRLVLTSAVDMNTAIAADDCQALASYLTLLEEDMEQVIDELYVNHNEQPA